MPIEASEPNDPAYEKTGSTAIQKAPPGLEALAAGEPADQADDSGNFDLDAALAIDAEDTNIMQAMTPDLDAIASESAAQMLGLAVLSALFLALSKVVSSDTGSAEHILWAIFLMVARMCGIASRQSEVGKYLQRGSASGERTVSGRDRPTPKT